MTHVDVHVQAVEECGRQVRRVRLGGAGALADHPGIASLESQGGYQSY